jgi:hypothetical protein
MSELDTTDKIVAAIFTAGMLAREDADTAKYLHTYERFVEAITKKREADIEVADVSALFTTKKAAAPKRKPAKSPHRKPR